MTIAQRVKFYRIAQERIVDKHEMAAHYDAGFDGGEWSGPWHGKAIERALDRVAQQLGFKDADDADHCIMWQRERRARHRPATLRDNW